MERSHGCPYCGNNPVPHVLSWYFESLDVWLAPLRRFFAYNRVTRLLQSRWREVGGTRAVVWMLLRLRILSEQNDITACKVRRAQVLWEEANRRGIKMTELLLFGRPFDMYAAENVKKEAGSGSAK